MSNIWEQAWRTLLENTSDWIIHCDRAGDIQKLVYSSGDNPDVDRQLVPGISLYTITSSESHVKIDSLLGKSPCQTHITTNGTQKSTGRQVNLVTAGNRDIPLKLSSHELNKNTILIAAQCQQELATSQQRLIKAQQSLQNDMSQSDDAEQQYKLIFDLCSDALLRIDLVDRRVIEANVAAKQLLEPFVYPLLNSPFTTGFDEESAMLLDQMFNHTRVTGEANDLATALADGKTTVQASMMYMHSLSNTSVLLRITPINQSVESVDGHQRLQLTQLLRNTPDAVVICTHDGKIINANNAFASMVQAPSATVINDTYLERWMARGSLDQSLIVEQLKETGQVDKFVTELSGRQGACTEIELSAARVSDKPDSFLIFMMRGTASRINASNGEEMLTAHPGDSLKDLVGRVPLKELVRESTDMIEKLCIETALELTHDNRASAAEILGVSRQSLYVKLRRFNIVESSNVT